MIKHTMQIIAMGLATVLGLAVLIPAQAATTWIVTNLNDSGVGSLRERLASAAPSGDIIQFDTNGTITLASSLNITSDVSIVGLGPAIITINGAATCRILTATNVNATISGLTFSNGLASGSDGGALYQAGGNITLSNCVFLSNRALGADGAAGGFGGAVFATGGVLTVRACTFSNNTAVGPRGLPAGTSNRSGGGGGGAGLGGALSLLSGTGYFYQCVFNNNSVTGGVGGLGAYGDTDQPGGRGGGSAGGAGGTGGSVNGDNGGEFSGGGGGIDDYIVAPTYGNGGAGGFGGGGGGGGANSHGGSGGTGGVGGSYAGKGGDTGSAAGGGGGGGAGLGGAIFTKASAIICSNVSLTGNSAVKGNGGSSGGANGTGAGGGIFCYSNTAFSMFQMTFSNNTADVNQNVYGAPAGYIGIEWGETAGLPANRYGIAAGVLSGEVYAVGGYETVSGNNAASNVYHYVGTNWVETVGLPQGRRNIAVGVCSGLLYAVGGAYGSPAMSNVYVFNGSSWMETNGLPLVRSAMGVGVLSGMVYAVGGYNGGSKTNVYKFDGSSWTEVSGLPSARDTMGCGVLNDRLYIVGGYTNTSGFTSDGVTNVFMFDGSIWTEVQGLPEKRGGLTACVWNGWLYAIGGREKSSFAPTNSVYRFDGTSWETVASLPDGRAMLASAAVGNQILAIGGTNGSSSGQTNVYFYPSGGVSPTNGSPNGGYSVTISGANLCDGTIIDVTNVTLCGVTATVTGVAGSTQIVVTADTALSTGLGDVRVYSASYGETVKSNAFTYTGVGMMVLGTNGAAIASGDPAAAPNGTDFGSINWGVARTNTLSITNNGNVALSISGVTTNGTGASAFSISNLPSSIAAGGVSNFTVRFAPSSAASFTAAVHIVNDSTTTPYIIYLAGVGIKSNQAITNFTPTNEAVFLTTNVVQLFAQASSELAVSFTNLPGNPVIWPNATTITFTATGTVSIVASQPGDATYAAAPDVTNTFNVLPLPVQDGWLAVQVTPASGSWALTTPAGYTGPTTGTGSLVAVSAVTGAYGIAYGALSGYVTPSNQAQFVIGGSTTLFAGVYLQISTNIGTPAGVSATEGTYTNKIRITWQGVAGATGYEIWRSRTNDPATVGRIASIGADAAIRAPDAGDRTSARQNSERRMDQRLRSTSTYAYDDYAINPINAYYYWVRAKTATLISPLSYVGMGYAALDPEQATGTADIAVSDLVFLPVNVTNNSTAGTVSCRLENLGSDALNAAGVAFDFYMSTNAAAMVWIGSAQSNMTLSVGGEKLIILTPSAKRGLTVRGDLSGVQQVKVVVRHLSVLNDPNLANNTTTAAGLVRIKTSGVNSPGRALNDYDGDGKSDCCLYRSTLGRWYMELSGDRYGADISVGDFGMGWTPVPGDYDGDGLTDVAAYNRSSGQWLMKFTSSGLVGEGWLLDGLAFTAAQSDFDGDSMTDPAIYREADGYWVVSASSRQYVLCPTTLGEIGYQSVAADYDGDGLADPTVYNRETGLWVVSFSGRGYQVAVGTFGGSGYLPVTADYDGDGLADLAIFDPYTADWQMWKSATLATQGVYTWCDAVLATTGGIPVPADYDGDGLADPTVYYPDTGTWAWYLSTQGYQLIVDAPFGDLECQPVLE